MPEKKWFVYMTYWSKYIKCFFFQVDTTITVFHIILFQIEVKIEEFWSCFYQFDCVYYENYHLIWKEASFCHCVFVIETMWIKFLLWVCKDEQFFFGLSRVKNV